MTFDVRRAVVTSLAWLATLALAGAAAYVVLVGRSLRPVADDYLIAAKVASDGPIGAVGHFWSTWVGDLFSWTLNVLFVGLPLAHWPLSMASSVAFVGAVVAVAAAGLVLVGRTMELPLARWALWGPILLSLPTLWWAYFWAGPSFSNPTELSADLASGITMWQTINAQYVIPIALLVTAWLLIGDAERLPQPIRLALFGAVGLLIGFTGVVVAVTFMTFIPLLALHRLITRQQICRADLYNWLVATVAALIAAVASHRSPGSAQRMTLLPDQSPSVDSFRAIIRSIPRAVTEWGEGLWTPGALVVLTITAGLGLLLALQRVRSSTSLLASSGIALLAMALIASIWNRISEAFSYEAFWHVVQVREITWLGLIALGFSFGALAARVSCPGSVLAAVLFAGAIGVVSVRPPDVS